MTSKKAAPASSYAALFGDALDELEQWKVIAAKRRERITRLRGELDQARQFLSDAPHDSNCQWNLRLVERCTCWKARL